MRDSMDSFYETYVSTFLEQTGLDRRAFELWLPILAAVRLRERVEEQDEFLLATARSVTQPDHGNRLRFRSEASEPASSVNDRTDATLRPATLVHPDYQGRGIGATCMRTLIERADARRLPIRLQVMAVNPRAVRFGFRTVGDTETHLQMERSPCDD